METTLQLIGATFYTLNKLFLWSAERNSHQWKEWRISAWIASLVGLPAWVIILGVNHNWIAATLEAVSAPAIVLGIVTELRTKRDEQAPRWLVMLTLLSLVLGLVISLYDFGGITTINQGLEIGLTVGFLVGTYQLATRRTQGYLWYTLMHLSCGWLMYRQDYNWLATQQVVSLVFICSAYGIAKKREKGG